MNVIEEKSKEKFIKKVPIFDERIVVAVDAKCIAEQWRINIID